MASLKKIKDYAIKYWWVIVGVLLATVGFLLGKRGGALRKWRKTEKKISDVEDQENENREVINEEHHDKINVIKEEHEESVNNLDDAREKQREELTDNVDDTTDFLNSVLRGGSND